MVSYGGRHSQGKGHKALSRKERRRRERAAKKARTAAYFSHGKGQNGGTAHVVTSSVGNKSQMLGKKAKKSESKPPISPERNQRPHKVCISTIYNYGAINDYQLDSTHNARTHDSIPARPESHSQTLLEKEQNS